MKVRDVMTTNVFTVPADMPLKQVATRMLEYGISGLPVVDEEQYVIGVLSETDILYKERQPRSGTAWSTGSFITERIRLLPS